MRAISSAVYKSDRIEGVDIIVCVHRRISTDLVTYIGDKIIHLTSKRAEMTYTLLVLSLCMFRKKYTALV